MPDTPTATSSARSRPNDRVASGPHIPRHSAFRRRVEHTGETEPPVQTHPDDALRQEPQGSGTPDGDPVCPRQLAGQLGGAVAPANDEHVGPVNISRGPVARRMKWADMSTEAGGRRRNVRATKRAGRHHNVVATGSDLPRSRCRSRPRISIRVRPVCRAVQGGRIGTRTYADTPQPHSSSGTGRARTGNGGRARN